ncbi:hypothetical protein OUZ56_031536 [Daphnia magna]|uniref:Uncharacterized protein n=1 Tax=Daphnia magna TaxID=35525 RepID=A0ABQ9ZUH7_9CRUS|nr:hypothetical protein OUZ56_031536 [Daphnia magna]
MPDPLYREDVIVMDQENSRIDVVDVWHHKNENRIVFGGQGMTDETHSKARDGDLSWIFWNHQDGNCWAHFADGA